MGTDIIRLISLGVNFWIIAVTMATLHLMAGRDILISGLNSLVLHFPSVNFCHSLPHYGNDIA